MPLILLQSSNQLKTWCSFLSDSRTVSPFVQEGTNIFENTYTKYLQKSKTCFDSQTMKSWKPTFFNQIAFRHWLPSAVSCLIKLQYGSSVVSMKSLFVSEHASCMHLHSHQFPVYIFTAYIIPSMFSRNNFMTTNNIRYGNGNDSNEILSTNFFSKFLQILDFRK